MAFPVPDAWTLGTADAQRDEQKRERSPTSFFFTQGQSLVLASQYFSDDRLTEASRGGIARKHRHRIHLSLFGQLMASFEYMLKDFVAKAITLSSAFDDKIEKADWIKVDVPRALANRTIATSVGAFLIHPTLGWHDTKGANSRYQSLFARQPIANDEVGTLERLWLLRHSVAHNAGFMIGHDAFRMGAPSLAETVVAIDDAFISDAFEFLKPIAKRTAEVVGDVVLLAWMKGLVPLGQDFARDQAVYQSLKDLARHVESRTQDLPQVVQADYTGDFARAAAP